MLRGFQRSLDLVHGGNAPRLLRMQQVDGRRTRPAHLPVGKQRRMHRKRLQFVAPEPVRQFHNLIVAGVVEVLPGGKNLHCLRTRARGQIQQSRMKTMVQK